MEKENSKEIRPKQKQDRFRNESEMKPTCNYEPKEKGSDKLKDKVALITHAGEPDEVAPCFLFLVCDDSSYITAQILYPNDVEIING